MCGVAGVLAGPAAPGVGVGELQRMAAALRHRGPDGWGLTRDDRVGLAHTRLAILDPAGGAQPLANEDGSVRLVFNGEIFNHDDLRRELAGRGRRFATRCDTEVVLRAYEEWGDGAWARFDGQFAIAVHDARTRRLRLVRDRFGILPLHWARGGGAVAFASEAKALFAGGRVAARLDPRGLADAFTLWATPAPGTVFEGVRSVVPGSVVVLDEELVATETVWARPDDPVSEDAAGAARDATTLDAAADALEARLTKAVELRLRADVEVGAYVSGGLDSSVIAHLARRIHGDGLRTFSVRFEDPRYDETREQRRMAQLLGTRHHEVVFGDADLRGALRDVIWHCETPLLRTGPVPMHLLSGLVRREGMKVVLTGEGADELLAGYDLFKEARIRRFWARSPESVARPALLGRLYRYVADGGSRETPMWREFFLRSLEDAGSPFGSHRVRWGNTAWTTRFLSPEVRAAADLSRIEQDLERTLPAGWRERTPLARSQAIETAAFLSPYLLASQGDRVAMSHSVEARYPFLDPAVASFCEALPDRRKLRGLRDKVVLRTVASRHLPEDVWSRPKHPYRAPTSRALLAGGDDSWVRDALSEERLSASGWIDAPAAARLVEKALRGGVRAGAQRLGEREEMAVVGLLTLQSLTEQFGPGLAPRVEELTKDLVRTRPDVFEDRTAGADPSGLPSGARAVAP